jgi:hypothetical protein
MLSGLMRLFGLRRRGAKAKKMALPGWAGKR